MIEIKNCCIQDTIIRYGNSRRTFINKMIEQLREEHFDEISIPIIQFNEAFRYKYGYDDSSRLFFLKNNSSKEMCLAPEYGCLVDQLAQSVIFRNEKNVKVFYLQEHFTEEKPMIGNYKQSTKLGIFIINPDNFIGQIECRAYLRYIAEALIELLTSNHVTKTSNPDSPIWTEGESITISCPELGAGDTIVTGEEYDSSVGITVNVDRFLILKDLYERRKKATV